MAELVVKDNVQIAIDGLDVSGRTNSLAIGYMQENRDNAVVNYSERSFYPGLTAHTFDLTAFFDADVETTAATGIPIQQQLFAEVGSSSAVLMAAAAGFTTGNNMYFARGLMADVPVSAQVGELLSLSASFVSKGGPAMSGQSGLYSTAANGATNGPGVSLGAVSATQNLYVAWQVLNTTVSAAGIVTSSTAAGDFSASTTRNTFTSLSTRGGEYAVVAGPITDTAFRFEVTTTAAVEVVGAFHVK